MGENFKIIAKTMYGFEDLVANEMKSLGAINVEKGMRMVSFEGDKGFMYKVNLASRTAIRILKPVSEFNAFTETNLYDGIRAIDWSKYLDADQTLAIDTTVFSEFFNHSLYVAQKSKDAIADQFREKFGKRPSVDLRNPHLRINIHIRQHAVSVALDSSGEPLYKRGYRNMTNEAPINESLAAGLLIMSGWEGQCDFLDPMCGSGTILVEAAMMATNTPAGINRSEYGFMKWRDWDPALYDTIRQALVKKIRPFSHTIAGMDKDTAVLVKAKENIESAGFGNIIKVKQENFFDSRKRNEGPLLMLFNPPYDERISVDTEDFYAHIGDTLKKHYPGTIAWLITANLEALKSVGLKASRRIEVANGQLEARLVKYEMYEGTRRTSFKEK